MTTISKESIETEAINFIEALTRGELPDYPGNLGKYHKDCAFLYSTANKFSGDDTTVRSTKITRLVEDKKKQSATFNSLFQDSPTIETITNQDSYPGLPEYAKQATGLLPRVSPWLTKYIEYSKRRSPEGYKDFHLACGLWVLSTVAARRIKIVIASPIMTPLSIVLVGRTSLFAKSVTAQAGITLLKMADLGFLLGPDETTPQRMLQKMAGHLPVNYGEMDANRQGKEKQRIAMAGQLGWYYDEFNQLINAMTRPGPMAEFAGLIRKLDNCTDEYRYETKGGGDDFIKNPYMAFLGSTTPANLAKHATRGGEFWNDGFWARMLFVCPPPNDFETNTMGREEVLPDRELIEKLSAWNTRMGVPMCYINEKKNEKGGMRYEVEVEDLPQHCVSINDEAYQGYKLYREALRSLVTLSSTQDLDGSYTRLATSAIRIAALIASLENNNRITLEIWAVAQEITELFRKNLHELYSQVTTSTGENPNDQFEEMVIEYMKGLKGEPTTTREIQRNGRNDLRKLKSSDFREIMINLVRNGIIEKVQVQGSKAEWFGLCA